MVQATARSRFRSIVGALTAPCLTTNVDIPAMRPALTLLSIILVTGCAGPAPVYGPIPDTKSVALWPLPPSERIFRVVGEVRAPGLQSYVGPITLTKAIESAGGFTEAASRKKLELHRADGSVICYNYDRIMESPVDNPNVYPGDSVEVKRKRFLW